MFCVDPRGLVEDLKDAEGEKKVLFKKNNLGFSITCVAQRSEKNI